MVSLEAIEAIDDIEQIRLLVKELLERVRLQDLELQEKDMLLEQKDDRIRELENNCEELMMQLEKHSISVSAFVQPPKKIVTSPRRSEQYLEVPQEESDDESCDVQVSEAKHTKIEVMHVDAEDVSEVNEEVTNQNLSPIEINV